MAIVQGILCIVALVAWGVTFIGMRFLLVESVSGSVGRLMRSHMEAAVARDES
jgi:hypothetical protein